MTTPDPAAIKEEQREFWAKASAGWRIADERIRRQMAPMTERMMEMGKIGRGMRVLDLASGTGEPGLPIAHAVGIDGHVLLSDQVVEQLDFAKEKAAAQGLMNVEFRVADAETLEVEAGTFDAVTCRWGIMFMPEPVRCLRMAYEALKPGGRLVLGVWGAPNLNPFFTVPWQALLKSAPDVKPPQVGEVGSVYAFAERSRLVSVMSEAGFRDIVTEDVELTPVHYPNAEVYWTTLQTGGLVARELQQLSEEQRAAVKQDLFEIVAGGDPEAPVRLDGYAIAAVGRK
jgi:ubiquinone/menaquinone biosynthesis C-methylase UbiE